MPLSRKETKVGDLIMTQNGKVGIITNIRGNNAADIVWISDQEMGLVNLWWLYLLSKSKKSE